MTQEELIQFWVDSSDDNYKSMLNMFDAGEYIWSLFIMTIELTHHRSRLLRHYVPRNDKRGVIASKAKQSHKISII